MTATELLGQLQEIGLSVALGEDGRTPILRGETQWVTSELKDVLALHRQAILQHLGVRQADVAPARPVVQEAVPGIVYWRMASGFVLTSLPLSDVKAVVGRKHVPYGATAFRVRADAPWRPISELPDHWPLKRRAAYQPGEEDTTDED